MTNTHTTSKIMTTRSRSGATRLVPRLRSNILTPNRKSGDNDMSDRSRNMQNQHSNQRQRPSRNNSRSRSHLHSHSPRQRPHLQHQRPHLQHQHPHHRSHHTPHPHAHPHAHAHPLSHRNSHHSPHPHPHTHANQYEYSRQDPTPEYENEHYMDIKSSKHHISSTSNTGSGSASISTSTSTSAPSSSRTATTTNSPSPPTIVPPSTPRMKSDQSGTSIGSSIGIGTGTGTSSSTITSTSAAVNSNRSESRCSQHSAASINTSSSSLPAPRTTTSRRGGRPPRSRSPLSYSSRSPVNGNVNVNVNGCHSSNVSVSGGTPGLTIPMPKSNSTSTSTSPPPASSSASNVKILNSNSSPRVHNDTNKNKNTIENKNTNKNKNNNNVQSEEKKYEERNEKEIVKNDLKRVEGRNNDANTHGHGHGHGHAHPRTLTPSNVAAKAAAEAQRLFSNDNYGHGNAMSHDGFPSHPNRAPWADEHENEHVHTRSDDNRTNSSQGKYNTNSNKEKEDSERDQRNNHHRQDRQSVFRRHLSPRSKRCNAQSREGSPSAGSHRRNVHENDGHGSNRDNKTSANGGSSKGSNTGRFIITRSRSKINKPAVGTGGTTLVMGSATPLHAPRAGPDPNLAPKNVPFRQANVVTCSPRQDPSSSSFFLSDDELAPPGSPQRLLLDFKSGGSKSFELRSPCVLSKPGQLPPLSPQEPPQIQQSHHQIDPNALFFEPQKAPRTPKTPKTPKSPYPSFKNSNLLGTPSFALFNQDFDSFDDGENYLPAHSPKATLLDKMPIGLGSPDFSLGRSVDDGSPRKTAMLNSPFMSGFDSAFSPRNNKKETFVGESVKKITMEGAPQMPQVANGDGQKEGTKKNILEFKSDDHRPPKKRILQKEKKSPMIPFKVKSAPPEDDIKTKKRLIKPISQVTSLSGMQPKVSGHGNYNQFPRYRSLPSPPNNPGPQPYSHKYAVHNLTKMHCGGPSLSGMKAPYFYEKLSYHKDAFCRFTFLLPGLQSVIKAAEMRNDNTKETLTSGSLKGEKISAQSEQSGSSELISDKVSPDKVKSHQPLKSEVAKRRVSSAVCAFGGNCNPSGNSESKVDASNQSIFRVKAKDGKKSKYEETLSGRYYENDNRISWEIEEDPPVEIPSMAAVRSNNTDDSPNMKRKSPSPTLDAKTPSKRSKSGLMIDGQNSTTPGSGGDQPKMRYRCKLCGQPKQNHTCPYQQSLQRNIGVMVYPAVNSFTALEPGYLAPALTEMNNFVNGGDNMYPTENTPSRPSPNRHSVTKSFTGPSPGMVVPLGAPQVTPEIIRNSQNNRSHGASSESIASTDNATPQRNPYGRPMPYSHYPMSAPIKGQPTPVSIRRKSILSPDASSVVSKDSHSDLLFVEKTDLRPEQYRIVSVSTSAKTGFKYPSLPLPYNQRKVLSDNLFALSKEVPQLTDECASVLRQAREQDQWDVAVAELLTQVIVVVHCPEEDSKLDGLSRYLLSLGFAC